MVVRFALTAQQINAIAKINPLLLTFSIISAKQNIMNSILLKETLLD
jgi:hypothetical protein